MLPSFSLDDSPVLFLLPLRCWNGCPKVSSLPRKKVRDDEATKFAKAESPEMRFAAVQNQKTLIALLMPPGESAAPMHQSVAKATQRTLSSTSIPLLGKNVSRSEAAVMKTTSMEVMVKRRCW